MPPHGEHLLSIGEFSRLPDHHPDAAARRRARRARACSTTPRRCDRSFVESGPDVEVQLDVIGSVTGTGDVRVLDVPEQQVAVGTLRGGFGGIGSVMEALAQWVDERGYRYAGPMLNIYVVGPRDEPDLARWVTVVCAPVAGLVDEPGGSAADATRSADGCGGA